MKRLLPFILIAVACISSAQEEIEELHAEPYIVTGQLKYMKVIAGATIVNVPSTVGYLEINQASPAIGILWEIYQTHTYLGGNLTQLPSPAGVYSISHGGFGQTRSFNFAYQWWNYLTASGRTTAQRYGTFRLSLGITKAGVPGYVYQKNWEWNWTPFLETYFQQGDANNPATNPGIDGDDLNNQPVNQGSFWSNLFTPSELSIHDFQETTAQWATWGPFGIYNAVKGSFESTPVSDANSQGYTLNFANYDMDLSPYQGFIRFARMLMAGTLWFIALFGFWRRVIQKA